ncbi:MAG: response regulator [Gammaproteobacteria bacterium]|nr:response regulator [Gammaproteobacteria bacterium]
MPKILFVDDEPAVLAGLRDALRREPFRIFTAHSADQALTLLEQETIDVIVSDERMPGICGAGLLARVCRAYPDTVRIILTGQANMSAAIQAINEGEIYRFLTKPVATTELVRTLHGAIALKAMSGDGFHTAGSARGQQAILRDLEAEYPGITQTERDADGRVIFSDTGEDMETLLREMEAGG